MGKNPNLEADGQGAARHAAPPALALRGSGCSPALAGPHDGASTRRGERGYTLVALLALMTIMMLVMTAAAPDIRQQNQRELEKEAIARGEEVAEAIRLYIRVKGAPPTSITQLIEGVPYGTKKIYILRAAAARDPLSSSGEWKLIRLTDSELIEFQQAVMLYAGGQPLITRDPVLQQLASRIRVTGLVNTGTREDAPGGEDDSTNTGGPFIGVASRSRRASVLTYYGIERHDQWVFTPLFK